MKKYWIWLRSFEQISDKDFEKLLNMYQEPEDVYRAAVGGRKSLSECVGSQAAEFLRSVANDAEISKLLEELERYKIRVITRGEPAYPQRLKNVYMPPPMLYVRGKDLPLNLEKAITIVGTRKCTAYGREVTSAIACDLAKEGVTVVSGMAMGIDTCAHYGALRAKSELPTVCVLAGGLEKASPMENTELFFDILTKGMAVSEKPPRSRILPASFPVRNRLMAGLSQGVLASEAPQKTGVRHTVDAALDLGLEVFAVPGRVGDYTSAYPLELIKEGAIPVTCGKDIIEHMHWQHEPQEAAPAKTRAVPAKAPQSVKAAPSQVKHAPPPVITPPSAMEISEDAPQSENEIFAILATLSDEERRVLSAISDDGCTVDEIVSESRVPLRNTLIILTQLERYRLIIKLGSGGYEPVKYW